MRCSSGTSKSKPMSVSCFTARGVRPKTIDIDAVLDDAHPLARKAAALEAEVDDPAEPESDETEDGEETEAQQAITVIVELGERPEGL